MAKRESRQKSRQSVATRGENKRAKGDHDTLHMVREWAVSVRAWPEPYDDFDTGYASAAQSVLAILNGGRKEAKP